MWSIRWVSTALTVECWLAHFWLFVAFQSRNLSILDVISLSWYNKFGHKKKLLPRPRFRTYNGQPLHVLGRCLGIFPTSNGLRFA
jgi:hypothetical protein